MQNLGDILKGLRTDVNNPGGYHAPMPGGIPQEPANYPADVMALGQSPYLGERAVSVVAVARDYGIENQLRYDPHDASLWLGNVPIEGYWVENGVTMASEDSFLGALQKFMQQIPKRPVARGGME